MSKQEIAERITQIAEQKAPETALQILQLQNVPQEKLTMHQWGGAVLELRGLTKAEGNVLRERAMVKGKLDLELLEKQLFYQGVTAPRFSLEQIEQLWASASSESINRVIGVLRKLNGDDTDSQGRVVALVQGVIEKLELPDDVEVDIDGLVVDLKRAVAMLRGETESGEKVEQANSFRR